MADYVVVLNTEAVAKALEQAPDKLIAALKPVIERWQYKRVAELARYPSPPPGSAYRRTGTLGRTWTAAKPTWSASKSGFESKIGNPTTYAVWVQGPPDRYPGQAEVHRDRWKTADDITEKAKPELEQNAQEAAERVAAQINEVTG